jgi:phosphate uptake regulator
VISLAGKTSVISLPASWCRRFNVAKGDELEVEERGNSILVSTEGNTIKERTTINAEEISERVLRWTLSGLHKAGFDEIEITNLKEGQFEIVEDVVKNLMMGFAIMEKTTRRVLSRSVSKDTYEEFDNALRSAFLVGLELAEESLKLIKLKQISKLDKILDLEKQNNKLTNFCQKILNKRGYRQPKKTSFFYVVAWNMEKVVDDYKYICDYLIKNSGVELTPSAIVLYEKANNYFRRYYELFYTFDFIKLTVLSAEIKDLDAKKEIYFKSKNEKELVVVSHLFDIILKCSDFSASFVAINTLE